MTDVLTSDFSEPGFLRRLRNWRDAMPWLALGQCLQPATSTIALTLSLIALHLGSWGAFAMERLIENHTYQNRPIAAAIPIQTARLGYVSLLPVTDPMLEGPSIVGVHDYLTSPLRRLADEGNDGRVMLVRLAQQFWLFAVWVIPAGYVCRRSVLNVAGRERMPSLETIKLIFARSVSFLSGPLLCLGFAILLSLSFLVLGYIDHLPYVGRGLAMAIGVLSIPIALLVGFLVFGTVLSFSMMWSSVMCERYADGFDAASRGFEYIMQRPFRFAAYTLMSVLLSIVAVNLASGVVAVAVQWSHTAYAASTSTDWPLPMGMFSIMRVIPTAFAFNLFWSFSAGIYLLLRRDANHQDVEDVWEPERPPAVPLPELAVSSRMQGGSSSDSNPAGPDK